VGILEIVAEISRILSFAFRLFGNVFAGEVLLMVISFLAAFVAVVPFMGLELFVGAIQALIFAMLSLIFFQMASHQH
jgi:F-type H+-transporting ATPase subunit a